MWSSDGVESVTDGDTRAAIAGRLGAIAAWRREREQQDMFGHGHEVAARSRRSADGLLELAGFVQSLDEDDDRLHELRSLAFAGEMFDPGATMLHELGRFRFHDPDVRLEAFFDRMLELSRLDASERGQFGGRQVPGDNPWRPGWLPPDEAEDEW